MVVLFLLYSSCQASCDAVHAQCAAGRCRYGTVVVEIGNKELSTLGRGKFVGERTLVTGQLRSASCIAKTQVTAIVMQKRDFLEVNNPMLDWMIPYDAARAVLKEQPDVKSLSAEHFETLLDRFQPKAEAAAGATLCLHGSPIDALIVFITGTVELVDAQGQVRGWLCVRSLLAACVIWTGCICATFPAFACLRSARAHVQHSDISARSAYMLPEV